MIEPISIWPGLPKTSPVVSPTRRAFGFEVSNVQNLHGNGFVKSDKATKLAAKLLVMKVSRQPRRLGSGGIAPSPAIVF